VDASTVFILHNNSLAEGSSPYSRPLEYKFGWWIADEEDTYNIDRHISSLTLLPDKPEPKI